MGRGKEGFLVEVCLVVDSAFDEHPWTTDKRTYVVLAENKKDAEKITRKRLGLGEEEKHYQGSNYYSVYAEKTKVNFFKFSGNGRLKAVC